MIIKNDCWKHSPFFCGALLLLMMMIMMIMMMIMIMPLLFFSPEPISKAEVLLTDILDTGISEYVCGGIIKSNFSTLYFSDAGLQHGGDLEVVAFICSIEGCESSDFN